VDGGGKMREANFSHYLGLGTFQLK
jgi:hypothetical protein